MKHKIKELTEEFELHEELRENMGEGEEVLYRLRMVYKNSCLSIILMFIGSFIAGFLIILPVYGWSHELMTGLIGAGIMMTLLFLCSRFVISNYTCTFHLYLTDRRLYIFQKLKVTDNLELLVDLDSLYAVSFIPATTFSGNKNSAKLEIISGNKNNGSVNSPHICQTI